MFEHLSKFRIIVVTGPQRSGTTIAAHMISHDTGHGYIDEDDYGTKDVSAWKEMIRVEKNKVIHSPAMSRWVHVAGNDESVLVVWMVRDTKEILSSCRRIHWNQDGQVSNYKDIIESLPEEIKNLHISEIKNYLWYNYQKLYIKNILELRYDSLRGHTLWIDRPGRRDFQPRQWEIKNG